MLLREEELLNILSEVPRLVMELLHDVLGDNGGDLEDIMSLI